DRLKVCDFSCSSARSVLLNGATSLSKAALRSSSSPILRPVSVRRLRKTSFSSPMREPPSDRFSMEIGSPPLPFRPPVNLSGPARPLRPKRSDNFAITTPPQPRNACVPPRNAAVARSRYYIPLTLETRAHMACGFPETVFGRFVARKAHVDRRHGGTVA